MTINCVIGEGVAGESTVKREVDKIELVMISTSLLVVIRPAEQFAAVLLVVFICMSNYNAFRHRVKLKLSGVIILY
jgi:hypothetical protein